VRLQGEDDRFACKVALHVKANDGCYGDCRQLRVTSHRLMWIAGAEWFAVRLDEVTHATSDAGVLRRFVGEPKFIVHTPRATVAFKGTFHGLAEAVTEAVKLKLWLKGSFEPRRLGGLSRFLADQEQRQQHQSGLMNQGLADLKSLVANAGQMVAVAGRVAEKARNGEEDAGEVQKLLIDFGISGISTSSAVGPGLGPGGLGPGRVDWELSGDVVRVAIAALRKSGGILLLHDLYALFNRALGTDLVTPDDLMQAVNAAVLQGQLRIRSFGGVNAVQLADLSEKELCAAVAEKVAARKCVTSVQYAALAGVSPSMATLVLCDAERSALLCRDSGYQGTIFHSVPDEWTNYPAE